MYADAARRPLHRQHLGQAIEPVLDAAIHGALRQRGLAQDRGDY